MKNGTRTVLLLLGDMLALFVAFWGMLYVAFYHKLTAQLISLHALPFFILGMFWIIIFFLFNLYDTQAIHLTIPRLQKIFIAFAVALAFSVVFFYFTPLTNITPKKNLVVFGGFAFIFFIIWRRIFYNIFASHFRKDIAFVVTGNNNLPQVEDIKNYITEYPQSGFTFAGTYDSLEKFLKESTKQIPQMLIVSKEIWQNMESFKKLQNIKSEVLDLAQAYEDILGRVSVETIDEGWFMHNVQSHQGMINNKVERILSIGTALIILIITSPLLLIIACLIKISDHGPIFYSQVRVGKNGKNFKLHKFRSMVVNAEKDGPEWSRKKDMRVTPIGKIIRTLHFDEIPQMWNVIKGDIALVGPRPERPEFVAELETKIPFYYLRHSIIPGFTGWAQIKFRYAGSVMDSQKKFEYDLFYMKNKNIFMDFGIMLRTIQIIFTH